jgi:3D (Asp-Asp-Asp) domain-containing protein
MVPNRKRRVSWCGGVSAALGVTVVALLLTNSAPSVPLGAEQTPARLREAIPFTVWLQVAGKKQKVSTTQRTVEGLLKEQNIVLSPLDRVYPRLNTRLHGGIFVRVVRIERITTQKTLGLPFRTVFRFSNSLKPGAKRVIHPGSSGEVVKTIEVWKKDGATIREKVLECRVQTNPVDRVVLVGDRALLPSRGGIRPRKVFVMEATAYSPGPVSCGKHADGYTSLGLRAGFGVAAVDPTVIPLGSRLFIEGYGFAVAADVGGAIKGKRIDLGYDTHREAVQFGRRRVTVYLLD